MYKVARGHFVDKSHSEAAKALGVSGTLELDNATGDLMVHFRSNQTEKPKHLTLSIVHPTHQQYDQNIMLKQVPSTNSYTGSLQTSLKGKRYLILEDDSASWNLRAEIHPPYDQNSIELEPAHN